MPRRDVEFLGLEVVSLEDAAVVGTIDGLIIDQTDKAVAGFIVDMGLYEAKALPFSDIAAVGGDAVTVKSAAVLKLISQQPELEEIAARGIQLEGMPVITDAGDLVGVVGEYYVHCVGGNVVAFEILDEDELGALETRYLVPASQLLHIGLDLVMVRAGFQLEVVSAESLRPE